MLNSGKKFRALRDNKNKYPNSRVFRKKNSNETKNHTPPPPPPPSSSMVGPLGYHSH